MLRVLTAGATREGLAACIGPFRDRTGIAAEWETTHGHLIREMVLAGETDADVVLLPEAMIAELEAGALVVAGTAARLGRIGIGAAVRTGAAIPDFSTMAALERAVLGAGSIVLTEAPSGKHLDRLFEEIGIAGEIAGRITRYDTGTMVNEHLVRSDAPGEIGFGVDTEILFFRDKGVTYAGALPEAAQMAAEYEAALLAGSDKADEARALLDYLQTPAAAREFADTGVKLI